MSEGSLTTGSAGAGLEEGSHRCRLREGSVTTGSAGVRLEEGSRRHRLTKGSCAWGRRATAPPAERRSAVRRPTRRRIWCKRERRPTPCTRTPHAADLLEERGPPHAPGPMPLDLVEERGGSGGEENREGDRGAVRWREGAAGKSERGGEK